MELEGAGLSLEDGEALERLPLCLRMLHLRADLGLRV